MSVQGIGEGSSVVTEKSIVVVIVVAVDSENRTKRSRKETTE